MFSSKSFMVSGLTFRYLIHFEFIFVNSVKKNVLLSFNIALFLILEEKHSAFSPFSIMLTVGLS